MHILQNRVWTFCKFLLSPKHWSLICNLFLFSVCITLFTLLNSILLVSVIEWLRKPHMRQIPPYFTLTHERTSHPTKDILEFSFTKGLETRNKSSITYGHWTVGENVWIPSSSTRSYCSIGRDCLMWQNKELLCQTWL